MKNTKDKEQLLEMIFKISNIESLDLRFGDSKYLLSNMIAKYTNSGKIFLSDKSKKILELNSFISEGEVKYKSLFYGKDCVFYKKHGIQFIAEHVVPCSVILQIILKSDKSKETIKNILDCNRVVMLVKEEDSLLKKNGFSKKITEDFDIYENIWGRYEKSNISVSKNFFINSGAIFR